MEQYTLNLIVIGITFAIYIGIAVWARAGSTAEFYAANRGMHPVANGMATGADWMSAASFISMAGLIAFTGYDNSTYLMGWTGGYVLLALLLAPYLRKFGKFTVPDFIGDRFYSNTARLVGVLCLIVISTTYVIGQMTGVGVTFSRYLEVSSSTGLWIGAALVFAYAVLGGMKGITYTQVAQYVVLIIAYTIPAIFISLALTGNFLPQLGLFGTHDASGAKFLTKLDEVVTDLGFKSYTGHHGSTLNMFLFTLSLMIGTAGLPHVIIRFFTVPRVADARASAGWALVFIALLYTVAPAVGSMARYNLTETMWPGAATGTEAGAVFSQPALSLQEIQTQPGPAMDADLGKDRVAAVGRPERRRADPVLQRQGPGRTPRSPSLRPPMAGRATNCRSSTTTSWCWPTRKSPTCRAGSSPSSRRARWPPRCRRRRGCCWRSRRRCRTT